MWISYRALSKRSRLKNRFIRVFIKESESKEQLFSLSFFSSVLVSATETLFFNQQCFMMFEPTIFYDVKVIFKWKVSLSYTMYHIFIYSLFQFNVSNKSKCTFIDAMCVTEHDKTQQIIRTTIIEHNKT